MAQFWKKKYLIQNVYFDFLYSFCLRYFSFKEELIEIFSQIYVGFHAKYLLYQVLMKLTDF